MNKYLKIFLSITITSLILSVPSKVYAAQTPTNKITQTKINNKDINLAEFGVIKSGENTLIPLRLIGEALNFEIVWEGEEKMVSLDNGNVKSTIQIGKDLYYKQSSKAIGLTQPIELGSAPLIYQGQTYVPISFFNLLYSNEGALVIKGNTLDITINPKDLEITQSLVGYMVIRGNTLYFDQVEIIKSEDTQRLEELALTDIDMPSGYIILKEEKETKTFELGEDVKYIFTDLELNFVKDPKGDRVYTTTNKDEFIQHLGTWDLNDIPLDEQTIPYFIEIKGKEVISITEKLEYTI